MVTPKTGNPMGRPREYDLKKVAADLLEWAQKDDSWNLCGFSADFLISPSLVLGWSKKDPDFCLAYELAKAMLGRRRERDVSKGKLHVKAYDLNATCYDRYLKDEKMDFLKLEASLKAQEQQALSEGDLQKYNQIQKMLAELQQQKKKKPSEKVKGSI